MKRGYVGFAMVLLILGFTFNACEGLRNEVNISKHGSDESHNNGQDCMSCHKKRGSGKGWFTVAGTVYDVNFTKFYPNATVKLFTKPDGKGELRATIEVDKYGNFYTTEAIQFGDGLYSVVTGNDGVNYMSKATTNGACNSCHGVSEDGIWTR